MATPIGHGLVGCAIGMVVSRGAPGGERGLWLACVVLAIAPDLDFVPGVFAGKPAAYHQGISHSLAFAMLAGLLAMLTVRASPAALRRAWLAGFAAYASHLALDWLGPDARLPYGMPFLWPLSDATFLSPVALLPGVQPARATDTGLAEWIGWVLSLRNALALGVEVAVAAPLLALAWSLRRRKWAIGTGGAPPSSAGSARPITERTGNPQPSPRAGPPHTEYPGDQP